MNLDELWQAILGELEVEQPRPSFKTWFKDTYLIGVEDQIALISVPSSFAKEWLEQKFHKQLKSILGRHLGQIKDIKYRVGVTKVAPSLNLDNQTPSQTSTSIYQPGGQPIKPDYIFETFVVGPSNRLAHATAKAVAERPGQTHNPLFIYGGVGLGKTHLIHAIGNHVASVNAKTKILYVSCEDFANEFIQSIQKKQMESFKKKYRSVDVFLIDDIQFLSRKEGTQEEFFHTFNTLYQRQAQIVMTSDRLPRAILDLEDRLSSRLGGGMIADIAPPNFETRLAILKAKTHPQHFDIPEDVLIYLAERIKTNIRDLEGLLNRLIAHCQLNQVIPTEQIASSVLDQIIQTAYQPVTNPQKVIDTICHYFGIKQEELMSKKRSRELVYPRQITMYLMRSQLSLSYPNIGKLLGGKDHTTIIHGYETINSQMTRNDQLKNDLNFLKDKISSVSVSSG